MHGIRSTLAVLSAAIAIAAAPTPVAAGPHPLFSDGGTLDWFSSLSSAQAAAESQEKLIFIDQGRLHCPNCRSLISQVLPSGSVRSRISAIAIGLADDADESDPRVAAILTAGVPDAQVLPIVGFVTANLRWVTGWSGYAGEAEVCAHLAVAEQRLAFWKKRRADFRQAALAAKPAPAPVAVKPPAPPPVPPTPFPTKAAETPRIAAKPALPAPDVKPAPLPAKPSPAVSSNPPSVSLLKPPAVSLSNPPAGPVILEPVAGTCTGDSCRAPARSVPAAPPTGEARKSVAQTPPASPAATLPAAKPSPSREKSTRALLADARAAAAAQSWKAVLKATDAAAGLPRDSDSVELDLLSQRAIRWSFDSLQSAADAAVLGRYSQAVSTLDIVRREMAGRVQEIDAERGAAAIERRKSIERGSPDGTGDAEPARRSAYSEYRGTRWAALFKPARQESANAPAILAPR